MVRKNLSRSLKTAGLDLLRETDALGMEAQAAMWIFSYPLQDWRYYLVSAIVDSAGKRKAYQLLIRAFEVANFPKGMTVEDVQLGSPNDELFQQLSRIIHVGEEGDGFAEFQECEFNGVKFDGVIYRLIDHKPNKKEAFKIMKNLENTIKKLEQT